MSPPVDQTLYAPRRLLLPRLKNSPQQGASKKTPATENEYKARAGKPKVRTGCVVCKIRRVKCDERKPACLRCTSTGRKCEGYVDAKSPRPKEDVPITAASIVTALSTSIHSNPGSPSNTYSIHVFCLISGNDFSRHLQSTNWTHIVLQNAQTYPTVRRSLNAVGSLYEAYLRNEHKSHNSQAVLDTQTIQFALVEYTKAVNFLSKDLLANRLPSQTVLICCLLFVWLEFLRNDFTTALRHLKSGLSILLGMRKSSGLKHSSEFDDIDDSILYIFTRLQLQATMHGCPLSDFNSTALECPLGITEPPITGLFSSLAEARLCLDSKMIPMVQFIRYKQTFERQNGPDITGSAEWAELICTRDFYVSELKKWEKALENSPALMADPSIAEPAAFSLKIDHLMAVMMMNNLFSDTEMDYDGCNDDFGRLVALSEKLLLHSVKDSSLPTLSLDSGAIPCLFYITLKCREPSIRHRAIHLLRKAPEREGIWHRDTMVAASAWKIVMEESCDVGQPGEYRSVKPLRIYRETVTDAMTEDELPTVRFSGGPEGSSDVSWELSGLLSRLGDVL
ncbi:hypothetical protein G7Z17_g2233 [Cylindrodendrum hubeiense]|uniref:Zn(2)-C6 fungal-type domain-containing protein n=1 Tax=Cylindrodendrum hubeiense TaxID=595255 RepID=A0A9P5HNL5_9HYPO|nr:hypothetical protein G7Z17_g2233 [Cylindrodendrum hubeiense]